VPIVLKSVSLNLLEPSGLVQACNVIAFFFYWNILEDDEKFHGFFRMNIKQFNHLSQLVGEEIRKQNTNYTYSMEQSPSGEANQ
jgi:hypothetical protein